MNVILVSAVFVAVFVENLDVLIFLRSLLIFKNVLKSKVIVDSIACNEFDFSDICDDFEYCEDRSEYHILDRDGQCADCNPTLEFGLPRVWIKKGYTKKV